MSIAIADFGIGNIKSVRRLFEHIGVEAEIVHEPAGLEGAQKLVLPGVGAFDAGVAAIDDGGWRPVLDRLALEAKIPVLGICLGMQLLCRGSDEGSRPGLGWVPADVQAFSLQGTGLKVPHMGWALVTPTQDNPLLPLGEEEQLFYHTHSYHAVCDSPDKVLATSHYGYNFASAIRNGNVFGTQFHPEKSHRFGMALLKRFSELA
ncbi:imidazole glycerol phosphate synthase subunit HisH [Ancylobacter sp. TS-1]|uniref:imidazole glycerol phosphate synthase subunit HisH n=1 Tax=Ancylobacter sp. TS-1 TaxID=1850374 RepID=UPI001265C41F|nr:imidazole glycerol phosphate synthase subunit HisH [Ancylobacter sp. TS-1]QFR33433.1 imidazole glycerol phosphate synthase subunit HisH [Ancylobacter sp. TS-1]